MAVTLAAVRIDANDPGLLARFWAGVLRGEVSGTTVRVPDTAYVLRFTPTSVPKTGRNRMHLDLTSASPQDQAETVTRALRLGGSPYDVGQRGDEGHVVLADPEGNEFCVIEPGNAFLAGCGPVGALNCEGTRASGEFWRDALAWPFVWDDGDETAIQSPAGGSKVTWSGPPLFDKPATGRNRWRLELATLDGATPGSEADRLVALGARGAASADDDGAITLADPDDNELHLH